MVDGYQVCDWLLVMVLPYLFFGWPGSCFVVGVARCVFLVGLNRPFRLENSLPQWPPSRVPRVWSLPSGQDVRTALEITAGGKPYNAVVEDERADKGSSSGPGLRNK